MERPVSVRELKAELLPLGETENATAADAITPETAHLDFQLLQLLSITPTLSG